MRIATSCMLFKENPTTEHDLENILSSNDFRTPVLIGLHTEVARQSKWDFYNFHIDFGYRAVAKEYKT
ncbi:MAG: hypothetical protein JWN56_2820 [Sphingobacteriales bacterium]|nr:hypothetical protein [Sphingobacteriales bacterium]